ncbi:hypothetical protein BH23CHL1_BH23CHL1_01780 [soil metagenome]
MGLGLGLGLLVGVRAATSGMTVVLLLVVVGLVALAATSPKDVRSLLVGASLACVLGLVGGSFRLDERSHNVPERPEYRFNAIVISDPRTSASGFRATVLWRHDDGTSREALVFFPPGVTISKGDWVVIRGKSIVDSDIGMVFSTSTIITKPPGWLETTRQSIRNRSSQHMTMRVPGSPGSLTLGLLIGDDSGLSQAERSDLRRSGLSHLTAVSGWNVSVVVASVGALFRALGARGWRWIIVQVTLLAVYVWIVGMEPPIQRAAIMGTVALIALHLGRPAHMLTSLVLTAGVMATWNPAILQSLSFMLSFLAMVGLTVASRVTSGLGQWQAALFSPALAAGGAGIATAPLLAATFGTFSAMTLPANVVAAPLIPAATYAGIVVVLGSWISPVAAVSGWLAWILSSATLWVSGFAADIPHSHFTFAPMQPSTALTIYLGLALAAAPLIPEGRAVIRRWGNWFHLTPAAALLAVLVLIGILAIGAVAV